MIDNIDKYDVVIGYGIGENYYKLRNVLKKLKIFDYVADRKWNCTDEKKFDGYDIISIEKIYDMENVLIIVIPDRDDIFDTIKKTYLCDVIHFL